MCEIVRNLKKNMTPSVYDQILVPCFGPDFSSLVPPIITGALIYRNDQKYRNESEIPKRIIKHIVKKGLGN